VVTIAESEQYMLDPAFSPDGRFVAFERTLGTGHFGSGHEIRVREFNGTSEWVVSEGSPTDRFWDPAWSPDGKWLYFQSPTTTYRRRVELEPTFRPVGSTEVVQENVGFSSRFAVNPVDGRLLVTSTPSRQQGAEATGVLVLNAFRMLREMAPPAN